MELNQNAILFDKMITIITPLNRVSEAEDMFLYIVNVKEANEDWNCINHRIYKRDDIVCREYVFENKTTGEIDILNLKRDKNSAIEGMVFDNVIYLGTNPEFYKELQDRSYGNITIL